MDLKLAGTVAYIGGSSRGIGLGIATAFLDEGASVAITGRDSGCLADAERRLVDTYGKTRIAAFSGDLEAPGVAADTLQAAKSRFGRIDCVVANVGAGTDSTGWDISQEEWQRAFSANFWSSQILVQQAIPLLLQNGRGSVILIASVAGAEVVGAPAPYTVAKGALIAFGKSLSRTLGPRGIRVNVVAPGNVLFPGGRWEARLQRHEAAVNDMIRREVPLGRFGSPEEIAATVVFLASERASFVTGACLIVDGGQSHAI